MQIHTYIYIYANVYAYHNTCIHAYMCAYIRACILTYLQTRRQRDRRVGKQTNVRNSVILSDGNFLL